MSGDRKTLILLTLLFASLFGGLASLAVYSEDAFASAMQEDSWAEWASFFSFAAAGAFAALAAVRTRRSGGAWTSVAILALLALFCVFVAGEEISWGQRLIAFKPPDVFLEQNYQQELNFHNFLTRKEIAIGPLVIDLDTRYQVAYVCILFGILFPLGARHFRLWNKTAGEALVAVAPPLYFLPWFALIAWAELEYPVDYTGEASELCLGTLFLAHLASCVARSGDRYRPRPSAAAWAPAAAVVGTLLLGAATAPVLTRVLYGADEEASAQARQELELLRQDLLTPGVVLPRTHRRNIHKRVFTAVTGGTDGQSKRYLAFGTVSRFLENRPSPAEGDFPDTRRDRRGYFLDPWNNPYWFYHAKQLDVVVLYSMGPNRRRDTDLKELSRERRVAGALQGDDIGVGLDTSTLRRVGG